MQLLLSSDRELDKLTETKIDTININNRKYLGSKYRLLHFLEKIILNQVERINTFIDGFAGTGVVANHFKKYSLKVISNDLLYSNYIINKVFLNLTEETVDLEKISEILINYNKINPKSGYITKHYGGTYFSIENAKLIDAIREDIEFQYNKGLYTELEKFILLTSLLFAIDKVANTVGQYDAFLKNLGQDTYDENGKHKIDSNVYKKLLLKLPSIDLKGNNNEVYNEDLNQLIKKISGDVLYLDPPYNTRQYIDNYHVLENIMRWNKPKLYGKTKKFKRDNLKSKYSRKQDAFHAFSELIELSQSKHIFLSYNNEGIISDNLIIKILKRKGPVEIFEEDYKVFGNGAAKSIKRNIKERIFYCKVYD